ncbi:hypothetical protein L2E82_16080 [Cichorium intybus]|uniref:Uncharacterized protein n=1 Tax=Cichorium intybus TaxID=13427 RepID=A0ACB9F5U8_CICIN|nr:hypothetical protein L2E82_16080 [Cichorium intybus]
MSSRRRLRVICSSDEEDDDDEIQEVQPPPQQHDDIEYETLNLQDVTLSSTNSNPTNPSASIQVELSDEDFIDVAEDFSPSPQSPPPPAPSPPPVPPPPDQTVHSSEYTRTNSVRMGEASGSPISRILEDLGLRLRGEWLDACLHGLQTAIPGFSTFDSTKKAKLCFERFLNSDMNNCGTGLLPNNVHQMHLVDLPGPFVLQVDEIVNISQPLRERYKKAPSGLKRCLKLSMTDGVQRVFGMEYQPIKDLDALSPAGLKVAVSNVNVRHGLLMLVPEVFQVLGGIVDELDAARQRLVNEVNKPPRGKRTRTGVVPSLATRATNAAWPGGNAPVSGPSNNPDHVDDQGSAPFSVNGRVSSNSSVPLHRENVSVPSNNGVFQNATSVNVHDQGITPPSINGRVSSNSSIPVHRENASGPSNNHVFQNATPIQVDDQGITPPSVNGRMPSNSSIPVHRERENVSRPSNNRVFQNATLIQVDDQGSTPPVSGRVPSNFSAPVHGEYVSGISNNTTPILVDDQGTTPPSVNTRVPSNSSVPVATAQSCVNMHNTNASFSVPILNQTVQRVTVDFLNERDSHMPAVQENRFPHECPFTYMATLSVKWDESKHKASHVQGKIKCFITGVKGFQFKKRSTYELLVYVDDGSLISEILIDHNVVQRKIGYSPEEVNAALSSSDPSRVHDMKDTMKQFQVFLVNFEGTMVVRINEASSLPVAIEMQQGCPLSDAWSLLTRLNSTNTNPPNQPPQFDPIDLSP